MIKFNINKNLTNEDLKEVNISSLLFDSGTNICNLFIGNIELSLVVNGEIRILNEDEDEVYKNYSQYPKKLTDLIKNGKDIEEYGYIIDMNNWFELFVDEVDENGEYKDEMFYEVSDIEGELDINDIRNSLLKYMLKEFNNYIGLDDIDTMTISDNEQLLLQENCIINIFNNYSKLAEKVNGIADEEKGKEIFMNNHKYTWIKILEDNTTKEFILESEVR